MPRDQLGGNVQLGPLHLVRIGDDAPEDDVTGAGHGREPRGDEAAGTGLGRGERQPACATELQHALLDRPLVAAVEPALQRGQQRFLECVGPLRGAGLDHQVDVDLELAGADRHLHPISVAAGLRERSRHRRLAHAEEAEHTPPRGLGTRQKLLKGLGLERARPQPLQLEGRSRQQHHDASAVPGHDETRRRPCEAERERALGNRRLLRHAGRKVGVVALQARRRRT